MSQTDTNDAMSYEDIGHLLEAKGEKLSEGDGDPEETIREVLETLGRSETTRTRTKAVDMNGRVSIGRDLSGTEGLTLFHPNPDEGDEDGDGDGN